MSQVAPPACPAVSARSRSQVLTGVLHTPAVPDGLRARPGLIAGVIRSRADTAAGIGALTGRHLRGHLVTAGQSLYMPAYVGGRVGIRRLLKF